MKSGESRGTGTPLPPVGRRPCSDARHHGIPSLRFALSFPIDPDKRAGEPSSPTSCRPGPTGIRDSRDFDIANAVRLVREPDRMSGFQTSARRRSRQRVRLSISCGAEAPGKGLAEEEPRSRRFHLRSPRCAASGRAPFNSRRPATIRVWRPLPLREGRRDGSGRPTLFPRPFSGLRPEF